MLDDLQSHCDLYDAPPPDDDGPGVSRLIGCMVIGEIVGLAIISLVAWLYFGG